jgi:hypothetical protein
MELLFGRCFILCYICSKSIFCFLSSFQCLPETHCHWQRKLVLLMWQLCLKFVYLLEYWQYCDICDRFDQGSLYLYLWMSKNTTQQEICMKKNHERSWQDHAGIMARSWWDLDKIFQDHGNIIIESWQDCDMILARIMMGSWQDPPRSWHDYNRILARFW